MTLSKKLKEYLEKERVHFETANHPLTYTAAETAGSQHVPGKKMVKSVIVKKNGGFIMCVLPAIHLLDFEKLNKVTGQSNLKLASETELKTLFPDYDLGAEPPFGHLYGMAVYADQILESIEEIVFNAGTHTDVVKMRYQDFKRLVKPTVADIGSHI